MYPKAYMNADNPGDVNFMEPDCFRPGNILYSNRDTLKSLDPDRWAPQSIAGRDRKSGYQEGKGFNARFNFMTSFYQFNSTTVVIADTSNDCVRTVNRITNMTSWVSGKCADPLGFGSVDGSFYSARFSGPYYFVKLPGFVSDGHEQLAFTDFSSIRIMDFTAETVSTMVEEDVIERPRVLTLSPDNSSLYFSFFNGVGHLELATYRRTILSQGYRHGTPVDGPLSSAVFGGDINAMAFLGEKVLIVSDQENNIIRVIDLVDRQVSSICQHPTLDADSMCPIGKVRSGDITKCLTCVPQSFYIMRDENKILLGGIGALGYIKTTGQVFSCFCGTFKYSIYSWLI